MSDSKSGDRGKSQVGTDTNSTDPKLMTARVFMGNFPADVMGRQEVEEVFREYGKILGISLHKTYGFVQYAKVEDAKAAVAAWNGKKLKGQVLDVNIATERRKEPAVDMKRERGHPRDLERRRRGAPYEAELGRRHHERARFGRRSPSPGRLEHEMRLRHMEMERMRMGPRFRGPPIDPYFDDFPMSMRDPYMRPRDDPYDRFHEPPPPRDLPRPFPREPPPRPREPPEWEMMGRAREERRPIPASPGFRPEPDNDRPLDMQIIVVNKQQKEYADHVRNRFLRLGLRITVLQLSPTMSLADTLDEAAESGLLYVVIISSQNELHTSVTLTILHGRNPQEHKNMPLDDALGLVDRDFERYCIDVRDGHIPARATRPQKPDVSSLLSKMASGEQLAPEQLDVVINQLQRQKEASSNDVRGPPPATAMNRRPEAPSASKESIESQQADLQAKILSLLGSSAVVPTASATQARPPQRPPMGEYSRPPTEYPPRPGAGGGDRMSGFTRPTPW